MDYLSVTFEITDEDLFNENVVDVDTTGLTYRGTNAWSESLGFEGSICIEKTDGKGWVTSLGQFHALEFEYLGFILTL